MQLEMTDLVAILNRIQMLEDRVAALESAVPRTQTAKTAVLERPEFPAERISEKYKRLSEYLYEKWDKRIRLSYSKITEILGFELPPTAYNFPKSYWANTKSHPYASSWLEIGYKAKVDGEKQIVVFERNLFKGGES